MKTRIIQKITFRYFWFPIVVFVSILIANLSLSHSVSARPSGIVLQQSSLPEGAVVLADGDVKLDEASHPLGGEQNILTRKSSSLSEDNRSLQMNFQSAHVMSVLVPSKGIVMNFSYQFATREGTLQAARKLRSEVSKAPTLIDVKKLGGGRGYLLKGDEGDSIYWFIGTTGNSLSLILVNGMDSSNVSDLFESTTQKVTDQSVDSVLDSE